MIGLEVWRIETRLKYNVLGGPWKEGQDQEPWLFEIQVGE